MTTDLNAEFDTPVATGGGTPDASNGHRPPEVTDGDLRARLEAGGDFILDSPKDVPSLWGHDDQVAWSEGEPLLLVGPEGVGKTTIAQQVVLARAGLLDRVLDMPVVVGKRRILYLACDRPRQVQRSFARMVDESDRERLNERLIVWKGPPPGDFGKHPGLLYAMCQAANADTVVVDSLKDVALKLTDDEVGAGLNMAHQRCVAEDVQVIGLHHQRKRSQGGDKPKTLDDVYGSRWITAGCGSVVLLWGQAGDPVVEWDHLKQPAAPVGPFKVMHDHPNGQSWQHNPTDIFGMVRAAPAGVTAEEVAAVLFDKERPTVNEVEKARRKLEQLRAKGLVHRPEGGQRGDNGRVTATRYVAVTLLHQGTE